MTAIIRLAARLARHRRGFAIVTAASMGVLVAGVAVSTLSVTYAASFASTAPLVEIGAALAVAVCAAAALTWIEQWVAHVLAYQVIDVLRIELHRSVGRLAPLGLSGRTSGDTVSRAIGDAEALEWFYAHTAAQVIAGSLASVVFSVVAVAVAGPSGLVVPLAHVLIILVPMATASSAVRQGDAVRGQVSALSTVTLAARQFARETVLLGRLDSLASEVVERTTRLQRARHALAVRLGLEQAAYETIGASLTLGAVALAVAGISAGSVPPSLAPMMIVFAGASLAAPLVVATALGRLGEVRAAARRVDELLDAPGVRPDRLAQHPAPGSAAETEGVRISDLRVSYPGQEAPVVDGLDLVAERGEILAVAGPSGAGKSTLLLALARLIPIESGEIEVDGVPITNEPAAHTRRRVSLVGQHAHVFRSSVRDNLLAPDASDEMVWLTLDSALLADRVRELPDMLDTVLNERGAGWSGGERQRLGLARGLIRDASVLLLDEPTAGLDPQAEEAFLRTLRSVANNRTVIVVTHRQVVMQASDRVAVLSNGCILHCGTHDELVASSDFYRALLQEQHAEEARPISRG